MRRRTHQQYSDTMQMNLDCTSGNGGIDNHAYKLAFLMLFFFPPAVPPDCIANELDNISEIDAVCLLLVEETSCDGLSVSSAVLVFEL